MQLRQLTFEGAGGKALAARLELPADGQPLACVLFAHCFTCTAAVSAAAHISRALTRERLAVFRFDLGARPAGDTAGRSLSPGVEDLVAAAALLEREALAPLLLLGHSLGGAAVIRAASRIPSVRAVATIGAPFAPAELFGSAAAQPDAEELTLELGGEPVRVQRALLAELGEGTLEEDLRALRAALLIFHSPRDQVVGIENAARIFQAANHPKSFVSLDDANHLLTEERDARYAGTLIASWASRFLPAVEPPTLEELRTARVVTRTGEQRYRTEILAGGHGLLADEPIKSGGTDTGPTPYDLIMAALGACTGITLRMYADRKGWPLEEVAVRLRHGRLHGEDREQCPDREVRVDRIERELELRGPLDEEQRARLTQIADRCPVHRTLSAGVKIETSVALKTEDSHGIRA